MIVAWLAWLKSRARAAYSAAARINAPRIRMFSQYSKGHGDGEFPVREAGQPVEAAPGELVVVATLLVRLTHGAKGSRIGRLVADADPARRRFLRDARRAKGMVRGEPRHGDRAVA